MYNKLFKTVLCPTVIINPFKLIISNKIILIDNLKVDLIETQPELVMLLFQPSTVPLIISNKSS